MLMYIANHYNILNQYKLCKHNNEADRIKTYILACVDSHCESKIV